MIAIGVKLSRSASNLSARFAGFIAFIFASHIAAQALFEATDDPASDPLPDAPAAVEQHVLSWFLIGGSSDRPENRYVGWSLRRSGWLKFVSTRVRPGLEGGIRRVLLHNPFGHEPPTNTMAFDAAINANQQDQVWLTRGFVEAWKPVVEGRWTNGEPVEVICYLGRLDNTPEFDTLRLAGDDTAFLQRAWASVELPLAAGMSIAVDSSATLPKDHPGYRFIRDLRDSGVRVYLEARPDADKPHLYDWPVVSVESYWDRSDPTRHPDATGMKRDGRSHGEVIQLFTSRKLTPSVAQEKLSHGYSVCADLRDEVWQAHKLAVWFHEQTGPP